MNLKYAPIYKYLALIIIFLLFFIHYNSINKDQYIPIAIVFGIIVCGVDYMSVHNYPSLLDEDYNTNKSSSKKTEKFINKQKSDRDQEQDREHDRERGQEQDRERNREEDTDTELDMDELNKAIYLNQIKIQKLQEQMN